MKLTICIFLLVISAFAWGDIAPAFYKNRTGQPKLIASDEIKMVKANVVVTWSEPCSISATFELYNKSQKEVRMAILFPIMDLRTQESVGDFDDFDAACEFFDFRMSLNGNELSDAIGADVEHEGEPFWLMNELEFRPGKNIVLITHRIEPRAIKPYSEGFQEVAYVMETGRLWSDPIEEEVVTFIFPEGIRPENIHPKTKPEGYKIGTDYVKWEFKNIEPDSDDNISMITNVKVNKHNQPEVATP